MKKIAIIGDGFTDRYVYGNVDRISPEAPVPVFDYLREESRGGGAINVANNLFAMGIIPTLFTITDLELPYPVITPKNIVPIVKTRYIVNDRYQIMRVDSATKFRKEDIDRMERPTFNDFDIIVFSDYNKGILEGGVATIVDTKKKDLSVFKGSKYIKINKKEYESSFNHDAVEGVFVTLGEDGMKYVTKDGGKYCPTTKSEIIDVTGAGDTALAAITYCLATGEEDIEKIMNYANKCSGEVVKKFGTSTI